MRCGLVAVAVLVASCGSAADVTIRGVYDGTLDPQTQVDAFRNIDRFFPSRVVKAGSAYPLPKDPQPIQSVTFVSGGRQFTLDDYLTQNRVAGLLVLHKGRIALERYQFGNNERTRWVSWSIAKSITSTLLGAALRDRAIRSLDESVESYVPELKGSAYGQASIRHVAQMASGVRWNEAYTDPTSERRQMLNAHIRQKGGAVLDYLRQLPRLAPSGTYWNYSTGDAQVLGTVVSRAVKRSLSAYASEKIWRRFGMENDATWWLDALNGQEIGGSGFSATLRDYGRFALFVLRGGADVVPAGWFRKATSPKVVGRSPVPYGHQWWTHGRGAFYGLGIFGQYLYVDPTRDVAIVVWSARQRPSGSTRISDMDFFTGVLATLASQR